MRKRSGPIGFPLLLLVVPGVTGCKSASLAEINAKTSFGPQYQNKGNNTHQVKYYSIQSLEFKLANKWTMGVMYQRTDVDDGSGDNENLVLFEVGYPIWNAPKKAEKTADEIQIEELEKELRQLDTELAVAGDLMPGGVASALVRPGDNDQSFEKDKGE